MKKENELKIEPTNEMFYFLKELIKDNTNSILYSILNHGFGKVAYLLDEDKLKIEPININEVAYKILNIVSNEKYIKYLEPCNVTHWIKEVIEDCDIDFGPNSITTKSETNINGSMIIHEIMDNYKLHLIAKDGVYYIELNKKQ